MANAEKCPFTLSEIVDLKAAGFNRDVFTNVFWRDLNEKPETIYKKDGMIFLDLFDYNHTLGDYEKKSFNSPHLKILLKKLNEGV